MADVLIKNSRSDLMGVVFITGATRNTGYAIAEKFASSGYDVAISSRSEFDAKRAALDIETKFNVKAVGYRLELSNVADIEKVFCNIRTDFGRLDVFVANSAKLGVDYDMLSVTEDDYDDIMNVNLKGTYFCCQQAALIMKENNGGSIVIIGSVHCKECIRGRSLYATSKGGLSSLTRSMAIELGALNIRANCIIAGAIRTERWEHLTDEQIVKKRANWPIGIESTGDDIANGVFYLGTDLSKTVTGTELTIDSGVLVSLLPFNGGKRQ